MLHNHLLDLFLAKLSKNCVDSIEKLGVTLGYADSILLLNGCIVCIGLACIVEGISLERLGTFVYPFAIAC